MKKLISMLLLVAMIAAMAVGCSGGDTGSGSTGGGDTTGGQTAAPAETYRWTEQSQSTAGTEGYKMEEAMFERMEALSGGRIDVEVQPVDAIASYQEAYAACESGTLDILPYAASAGPGMMGPISYITGGSGNTGGLGPYEYAGWVWHGGGDEMLQDLYAQYNTEWITVSNIAGAEVFSHSNVKLDSVEAFNGIKFRTMGLWAEILSSVGASVVNISGGDIYQSADRGLIDAFEYVGPQSNYDMGFAEITKYMTLPGVHSPLCSVHLIMNPATYEALPDDIREIVYECAKSAAYDSTYWYAKADAEALISFEKDGTETVILPMEVQDEFVRLSAEIHKKNIADDERYAKMFYSQKDWVERYKATQFVQPSGLTIYELVD